MECIRPANSRCAKLRGVGHDAACIYEHASSILHMENCVAADSLYGVYADGTIVISNSTVTNNSHGLFVGTGAITSLGNNRIYGNTTDGSPTTTIAQH